MQSNRIHHNGNSENPVEQDVHGMSADPRERATSGCSTTESAITAATGHPGRPAETRRSRWAQRRLQSRATGFHEDRENGVDIKKITPTSSCCLNALYRLTAERSSSAGEAVVAHDLAERVWVINNFVAASVRGIVSTGVSGYVRPRATCCTRSRHRPRHSQVRPELAVRARSCGSTPGNSTEDVTHEQYGLGPATAGVSVPHRQRRQCRRRRNNTHVGLGDGCRTARFTFLAANLERVDAGDPRLVRQPRGGISIRCSARRWSTRGLGSRHSTITGRRTAPRCQLDILRRPAAELATSISAQRKRE